MLHMYRCVLVTSLAWICYGLPVWKPQEALAPHPFPTSAPNVARCELQRFQSLELGASARNAQLVGETGCETKRSVLRGQAGRPALQEDQASFLSAYKINSKARTSTGHEQRVVSITSFARSGSSTVLSMVSNGAESNGQNTVFSLFEPAHVDFDNLDSAVRDKYEHDKGHFMLKLAHCDFSGIYWLDHWYDTHSSTEGTWGPQDPVAHDECVAADVIAIKDVTWGRDLKEEVLPLLDEDSRLRSISIVRDPRGIISSQEVTDGGNFYPASSGVIPGMFEICEHYAENLQVTHDRLHVIVFEELTTNPTKVMKETLEFLGLPFGEKQASWIHETFDAACEEVDAYNDCHRDSKQNNEHWRELLTTEQQKAFLEHPACLRVASAYGFPAS